MFLFSLIWFFIFYYFFLLILLSIIIIIIRVQNSSVPNKRNLKALPSPKLHNRYVNNVTIYKQILF